MLGKKVLGTIFDGMKLGFHLDLEGITIPTFDAMGIF